MPPRVLRRLLILLLALTAVALLWDEFGMDSTLVVDARSPYILTAVDDRIEAGGRSAAGVSRDGGALALECQVAAGFASPYCEMRIEFRRGPDGIDLSRYDRLRLWVAASGPEPRQRVRLSLRDYDPAYAKPGQVESQKLEQVVYEPSSDNTGVELPLARLAVAQGWLDEHPSTFELEAPDFRNVTMLSFSTGPNVEPGPHRIRVERIEFRGKPFPDAAFRLGIIIAWLASVFGYLVVDGVLTRNQLRLSATSQISLQRLNESLRLETRSLAELARTDPLTGVLNRKGLADELTRMVHMGGDSIFPLTLVFIDIDHFKRINDEHGNAIGDQVIRGLTDLVRSAVQRDDLFARWGGEEFLLVFRNTSGLEGRAIAERLRERISSGQWPGGLRLTCSFGVAEWLRGEDLNEGVKRADEAMYRAKQNGRDRVEMELAEGPAA